jgi:hypothetical protein
MPVFTLQAPDGRKVRIEAADQATAMRGAQEWYASQGRAKPARKARGGDVLGAAANLYQSIPLMDEGAAALDTGLRMVTGQAKTIPEAWRQAREMQGEAAQDFQARRPTTTAVIRGAGTGASVFVPAGRVAGAFSAPIQALGRTVPAGAANAARGATLAAGNAYAYGAAGEGTLEERAAAGTRAATDPATLAVGAVAGRLATPSKPKPKAAPTRAELTAGRKAAYAEVKASGQQYAPEEFADVVQAIKRDLAEADFDPDFDPAVATMLRKLDEKVAAGYSPTIGELDRVRRSISKNVARRGDGNQRRLGSQMIRSLDESLDATGGDEALKRARDLYSREQKVRAVDVAMGKAKRNSRKSGSGANGDNAIRQRMDALLKTPGLKPDEIAAIEDIVNGDPVRNVLRSYGQTSPISGGLAGMLNAGALLPTGGNSLWMHSIPSTASKVAADQMAKAKVRDLVQLMAAGGTREQLLAIQQQVESVPGPAGDALRRMVAARLASAAGAQGGARATYGSNPYDRLSTAASR